MQQKNPLVSICVVSYNHAKFIPFCIHSLWNQIYKNIEILVLDDGSSDNSVQVLNSLKQTSPCPMTIVAQPNSGNIGKNFNTLLKAANGKYISIISADDALLPEAISKKVQIMEENSQVQFVINSQIQRIDEHNNYFDSVFKMTLDKIKVPSAQDTLFLDFHEIHSYYLQGSLFTKSILMEIGGYDEQMTADDIVLRTKLARFLLQHSTFTFVTLHEVSCLYRTHLSNTSANLSRQLISVATYLDKYWPHKIPSPNFRDLVLNTFANTPNRHLLYTQVQGLQAVQYILRDLPTQDFLADTGVCYKKKSLLGGLLQIHTYKHLGAQYKACMFCGHKLFTFAHKRYH